MADSGCIPTPTKRSRISDTCFAETTFRDPSKQPTIINLKCPKTSVLYLDEYFYKWDDETSCCLDDLSLPFYTDYNKPNFDTEYCLYKYLRALREPMLIVNDFQHNTKAEGGVHMGILDKSGNVTVQEIDILVVHRDYGLLLFEVKSMKKVVMQTRRIGLRCRISEIEKSLHQLNRGWNQVKEYLQDYFSELSVKFEWEQYWHLDKYDIDKLLQLISNDEKKQTFLCLFNEWRVETDTDGNHVFHDHDSNVCKCLDKGPLRITTCNVLKHNELKDFESFKRWWESYFSDGYFQEIKNIQHKRKLPTFAFLLNRFGLDFYLSNYYMKPIDILSCDQAIIKKTNQVKIEFHTKEGGITPLERNTIASNIGVPYYDNRTCLPQYEKQQIKLLWNKMQKKILLEANLAFISGPPGTGKTILLIEKVRNLLSDGERNILIITGKNESLRAMINCEFQFNEECCEKSLYIFTYNEFYDWCHISDDDKRFHNIFVDEGHDLIAAELTDILENHTNIEKTENQHFWILYDSLSINNWRTEGYEIVVKLNSKWNRKENYFTCYYLTLIFQQTRNQFLSLLPIMENVCCTNCINLRDPQTTVNNIDEQKQSQNSYESAVDVKVVCEYCRPWHSVTAIGPKPLYLPWIDPKNPCIDNTAELVIKALILSYRNEQQCQEIVRDQIPYEVNILFQKGLFGKSTILVEEPKELSKLLHTYLKKICGLDYFYICTAAEYYEKDRVIRENCLTVDTPLKFQGLVSAVVIYAPFLIMNKNKYATLFSTYLMDKLLKQCDKFLIILSRATCRSVFIGLKTVEDYFKEIVKNNARKPRRFIPIGLQKSVYDYITMENVHLISTL